MIAPNVLQSIEGIAQVAASAFVASLWQGVVLAAAVWLCLRLMPKLTAAVRFAVWSAVFVAILLLPLAQMSGSHAAVSAGATFHLDVRWSYLIAAAWAMVSLARGAKLAVSAWRLHGLWKRSTPVPTALPMVGSSARSEGGFGAREVQICTSTEIDRPSVIGFFKPRVLIPEWLFEKLTPGELEQIVMHEFGHISRADDWINLFQKIGLVLFPLNPALMWIDRRLCFERELACDDGVLEHTHAPGVYATCLVSLAERAKNRRVAPLSLGAWERKSELGRRVQSILRSGERMSRKQAWLAGSAVGVALLGGAAGLSKCPHFVAFTEGSAAGAIAERAVPIVPNVTAAEYRPVVFHPERAPHATLLKATLPAGPATQHAHMPSHKGAAIAAPARAATPKHAPTVERVKQASAGMQRWVVLTTVSMATTDEPAGKSIRPPLPVRPGMMLAVDGEHAIAAVPTGDGWLVFQL